MKVLLVNGSPNPARCTYTALKEIADKLQETGIDTQMIHVGNEAMQDCIGCWSCVSTGECAFRDKKYLEFVDAIGKSDGIIVGSPVYFAGPTGALCSLLNRVFSSKGHLLRGKPAASIVSCRRGGGTASVDRLNRYFTYSQMPVVASQYWPIIHGNTPDEVRQDEEGLQVMRTLANNMAWLLESIESGNAPLPKQEDYIETSFIR